MAAAAALVLVCTGVVGCGSQGPQSSVTVPAATPGVTASVATPTAGGDASRVEFTAEALSSPEDEYTVVALPEGLGPVEQDVVRGYLAHDIASWRAYRAMDGDLSGLYATASGLALLKRTNGYSDLEARGAHVEGWTTTEVLTVTVGDDEQEATLDLCFDQTGARDVDAAGNDVTNPEQKNRLEVRYDMKKDTSGAWVAVDSSRIGVGTC